MEQKRTVIFAAGTGNPYFTTDTAAVLRAIQMKADVIIKATNVDGVYSADPKLDPTAIRYDEVSYRDCDARRTGRDGPDAITLCKEKRAAIGRPQYPLAGGRPRVIRGERVGTLVR